LEGTISKIFAKLSVFWAVFILSTAIFSVWLYAFYPANLSIDSINQLTQIASGKISNAHPYVFTLFLGIFVKYLGGIASFIFFQILLSSLIAALFAIYFYKKKVNKYLIVATLIFFWLSPAVGIYNVTMWKDVIFSQLIVLLGYVYLRFLDDDSQTNLIYVFLGLSLLIAPTRHNGAVYLLLSPLLLFLVKKINWKGLFLQVVSLGIVFIVITGPVATLSGVNTTSYVDASTSLRLQLVAAVMSSNDANITAEETIYFTSIIPKDKYVSGYRCSSIDGLMMANRSTVDSYFANNNLYQKDFASKSNQLFLKNLPVLMADRTCLVAYQLGFGMKGWYDPFYIGVSSNKMDYIPRSSFITAPFTDFFYWSIHLPQRVIFWNHALALMFYAAAFVYGIVRKSARIMGFVSIICINVPLLVLVGVSNDYRYLYMLTLGVLFLPGLILSDKSAISLKDKHK